MSGWEKSRPRHDFRGGKMVRVYGMQQWEWNWEWGCVCLCVGVGVVVGVCTVWEWVRVGVAGRERGVSFLGLGGSSLVRLGCTRLPWRPWTRLKGARVPGPGVHLHRMDWRYVGSNGTRQFNCGSSARDPRVQTGTWAGTRLTEPFSLHGAIDIGRPLRWDDWGICVQRTSHQQHRQHCAEKWESEPECGSSSLSASHPREAGLRLDVDRSQVGLQRLGLGVCRIWW